MEHNNTAHKHTMQAHIVAFKASGLTVKAYCLQHKIKSSNYWDTDGFALYEKRLEKGTFERPVNTQNSTDVLLTNLQLQHILQGIVLKSVQHKKRYTPVCKNTA